MSLIIEQGTFRYKNQSAIVTDLSFEVLPGELLAILGPNGVGKTTLLRCILGLLNWNSGVTRLDGVDVSTLPTAEKWQKFAFVPQARNAVSLSLSGLDMVTIGRAAHLSVFAVPQPKDVALAEQVMAEIGISHLANVPCGQMSGGQFQMILIARALVTQPQVLVLDEPETGLDFRNQLIVLDLLDRLVHELGLIVLMNTHYPTHALRVADKSLLLSGNQRTQFGKTTAVVTEQNLAEVFQVRVSLASTEVEGQLHKSVLPISVL